MNSAISVLLGLACAACCGDDVACEQQVFGAAPIASAGPLAMTLTGCRNGTCADAELSSSGERIVSFNANGPAAVRLLDPPSGVPESEAIWKIHLTWFLDQVEVDHGDLYRVRLFDQAEQREVFDVEHTVAYDVRCGCYTGTLQLPHTIP